MALDDKTWSLGPKYSASIRQDTKVWFYATNPTSSLPVAIMIICLKANDQVVINDAAK